MTTDTKPATDPVPLHRFRVPEPEAVPIAVGNFDSLGPASRADYPHRHTFYEVVLATGGTGHHVIDFTEFRLRPPQLGLITPGQVHFWRNVTGLEGRVLLFTEAFLALTPGDWHLWHRLADRSWLSLNPMQAGRVSGLLAQMETEYHSRGADSVSVLRAFLHVLLVQATRVPDGGDRPVSVDRATVVAREFVRMLSQSGQVADSVAGYAGRLQVSSSYLAEAVKTATGETPGQLIRRFRILEARRLLGSTDLTVGQISRHLGFDDPSYFCRFFRRETGSTPTGFRHGEKHQEYRNQSID
ncbi:AraC-like DNA-binding protein [Stackebrandtia endophytica]|uniref:AraC-like DNA-binding protein n=1 Tax=Stackebrandtia endophytica TaxID=1496996 RepID=A0A543AZ18_9ACTN|nr:AraC family transcriptional regulator [Stackebrandtia endophytica]TQL77825.1 AraC-like DNA-binding protein [Stackebrandtia endophytica]